MKISNGYVLRTIYNETYLLPYGQNIADYKRGVKLNETGQFIWNELTLNTSYDKILSLLIQKYSIEPNLLQEDLNNFLSSLQQLGIITNDTIYESPSKYYLIANQSIAYHGPTTLIHPFMDAFEYSLPIVSDEKAMIHWFLSFVPMERTHGALMIIDHPLLQVFQTNEYYILRYPQLGNTLSCKLSLDGTMCTFHLTTPGMELIKEQLFYAFRTAFLLYASSHGYFALHSASLLYKDKAFLFSGQSGTGKTTHTNLWKEILDIECLNGDLNLISIETNQCIVWGIPWCGTSSTFTTKHYLLGGIILLKQTPTNVLFPLTEDEKALLVMQRFISPTWTIPLFDRNLSFAKQLVTKTAIYQYGCTKDKSAVSPIKEAIDSTLPTEQ